MSDKDGVDMRVHNVSMAISRNILSKPALSERFSHREKDPEKKSGFSPKRAVTKRCARS